MFSARGRTSVPDAPLIHEVLDDVEALDDWPAEASQTPAAADQPPFSLLRQTLMASLDSRARCSLQRQAASRFLPSFCRNLQERPLNIRGTDKIFAMSWLDPWSLLCATKCNQLLRYCMRSHTTTRIPQPPLPQGVRRPAELVNQEGRCGVHSVAISPSRTLLATGGEHPNDTLVYRLPDLQPLALCLAHQDWMFAATWLTDQHLATGGRDGKLLLWRLDCSAPSTQPPLAVLTQPQRHTIVDVKSRCRDLVYCGATRSLVHLEPRGLMACWDPGLWRRTAQWQLGDSSSWCCLAMREDLVAAGGTDKVALVDPRQRRPVLSSRPAASLFSHLDSEGVRSLRLNHHLLSCGQCSHSWLRSPQAQPPHTGAEPATAQPTTSSPLAPGRSH
ncbi:WD40-repeat-containing domain protein [Haematococcus lacustris]